MEFGTETGVDVRLHPLADVRGRAAGETVPAAGGAAGALATPGYDAIGIVKAFSGIQVLRGVSLTFRAGEIHTLVGENGAGKSTLLKIMSGVYPLDAGTLRLNGTELGSLSPSSAHRTGIYLVPQEPRLMPDLSVAENLYLGTLRRGRLRFNVDWRAMNGSAGELLGAVGLNVDPRMLAGRLPLAHQQLLECAKALSYGCRIIFFDEPTSPLTSHEADRLFALMHGLREQGMTLGFISHRLDEVERLSDRITVLRDGAVTARWLRGEAARGEVVNAMVGRELTMTKRVTRPERTGPAALEVDNLVSLPEVKGISLAARPGEIVGLGGLVGSGRTEFSETIFGLRTPSAGRVRVAGRDITGRPPDRCIDAGLVYLAEDRGRNGIFAEVDLVRNASSAIVPKLPRRAGLLKRRREQVMTQAALESAGVRAASMETPIRSLSGGNQQKVLLSRWTLAAPKVAIFDEPTRGVDVGAKEGIFETIEGLAASGLAIVVICSELEELVRLCDRVYVVYEGQVAGELKGDDITVEAVGRLAVGDQG